MRSGGWRALPLTAGLCLLALYELGLVVSNAAHGHATVALIWLGGAIGSAGVAAYVWFVVRLKDPDSPSRSWRALWHRLRAR